MPASIFAKLRASDGSGTSGGDIFRFLRVNACVANDIGRRRLRGSGIVLLISAEPPIGSTHRPLSHGFTTGSSGLASATLSTPLTGYIALQHFSNIVAGKPALSAALTSELRRETPADSPRGLLVAYALRFG